MGVRYVRGFILLKTTVPYMCILSVSGFICSYNIQRHINTILLNRCRYFYIVQELLPCKLQTFANSNNRQITWTVYSEEFKNVRRSSDPNRAILHRHIKVINNMNNNMRRTMTVCAQMR